MTCLEGSCVHLTHISARRSTSAMGRYPVTLMKETLSHNFSRRSHVRSSRFSYQSPAVRVFHGKTPVPTMEGKGKDLLLCFPTPKFSHEPCQLGRTLLPLTAKRSHNKGMPFKRFVLFPFSQWKKRHGKLQNRDGGCDWLGVQYIIMRSTGEPPSSSSYTSAEYITELANTHHPSRSGWMCNSSRQCRTSSISNPPCSDDQMGLIRHPRSAR